MHWGLGWAVVARGGGALFSVHCVYFLWVRGYWSRVLQTSWSKEEGREVSSVGRKVARLTQQQAGQQLAYLASLATYLSVLSLDSSDPGKEPCIAFR